MPGGQRTGKGGLVDDPSPCDVQHDGAGSQRLELGGSDHPARPVGEGGMHGEHIRARQELG